MVYSQKGISLYLAIILMSVFLSMAFGLSGIFISQIKTLKGMEYSVAAIYAADAGIERTLVNRTSPSTTCTSDSHCSLLNGAEYYVIITPAGITCPVTGRTCLAPNYCVKSVGIFKETRRAIEISY